MSQLNPFVWDQEIEDGLTRSGFAVDVALKLKAGQHIALFGPRGTGKTTFTLELANELRKPHGDDAVPWECIRVDLRSAISLERFIVGISQAVDRHPSKALRRRIKAQFTALNKEFGINIGVVKLGIASGPDAQTSIAAILSKQLAALRTLDSKLVVIFDEFQRLASCPGDPLSIIRTSLMSPDGGQQTSLLFTGSLRQKLDLLLHDSTEPIWDQTHDMDLPALAFDEFAQYIEFRFEATGKPIDEDATDLLFSLTDGHPKRTQQLAWQVWESTEPSSAITAEAISDAFDFLVENRSAPGRDFAVTFDNWMNGDDSEINNAKTLLLLASGETLTSRNAAAQFGIGSHTTALRAADRLAERGYVERQETGSWRIVDPLFREYLRRQADGNAP
jgi:energy-coupling factor transporter ATP-binding protein EcfA2